MRDEHEATQAHYDRYMARRSNVGHHAGDDDNGNAAKDVVNANRPSAEESYDFFTRVWDGKDSSSVRSPQSEGGRKHKRG